MLKKSGFTLAEILITLVIIGVIAALSIPNLLLGMEKQRFVAALQRVYSNLNQAVNSIKIDNGGTVVNTIGSTDSSFLNLFANKMSFIKLCYSNSVGNCWHSGNEIKQDGADVGFNDASGHSSAILLDGTSILFKQYTQECISQLMPTEPRSRYCGIVNVDVNGLTPPNKMGRDIFSFYLFGDRGFLPFGSFDIHDICDPDNHYDYGFACTYRVIKDGAMNY